ncbi:MAG: hypothetical protein JHC30_05935 [Caldisericum sp.]|jgi:hypothetical protein|nr:hypothetical protein [Caldisericum sp.]
MHVVITGEQIGLINKLTTLITDLENQIGLLQNEFVIMIWGVLALLFIMAVAFYIAFKGR